MVKEVKMMNERLTIKKVSDVTGVPTKTLRFWEAEGLLMPQRYKNSYRSYGRMELTTIFYIKSLRALEMPLVEIKQILANKSAEELLKSHLEQLKAKQRLINLIIRNLSNKLEKGEYTMTDKDFEVWKTEAVRENDERYGKEIREKYGETAVQASYKKFKNQSEAEVKEATEQHEKIVSLLEAAFLEGDKAKAREAVELHREWLQHYWPEGMLTAESHKGLADMYVADERFRANYDRTYAGLADYFREAIYHYYEGK
jgi:DNA-binding transcriptional MerR regulator